MAKEEEEEVRMRERKYVYENVHAPMRLHRMHEYDIQI